MRLQTRCFIHSTGEMNRQATIESKKSLATYQKVLFKRQQKYGYILLMALFLCSCLSTNINNNTVLNILIAPYKGQYEIDVSEYSLSDTIKAKYPLIMLTNNDQLQKSINNLLDSYIKEVYFTPLPNPRDRIINVTGELKLLSNHLLSIFVTSCDITKGAAHEIVEAKTLNIKLSTMETIDITDVYAINEEFIKYIMQVKFRLPHISADGTEYFNKTPRHSSSSNYPQLSYYFTATKLGVVQKLSFVEGNFDIYEIPYADLKKWEK